MSAPRLPWDLEGWSEIAAFLDVSERTAIRYAQEPDPLPVHRFGRGVRARREELSAWAARRLQRPTESACHKMA